MKTTNNTTNIQVNAKNGNAADNFRKVKDGFKRFVHKAKPVAVRFFTEKIPAAAKSFERLCHACARFVHGCINLVVKMSIILIALLMLQNYIKANPAEWAQIVSACQNAWNTAYEAVVDVWESSFFFWLG